MPAPVVCVDVPYLCYRAFYATGGLSHRGDATGVVFGVMRAVKDLEAKWPLCRLVFCFDHGKGLREQEFPGYKATRRAKRKEEMKNREKRRMWDGFRGQVEALRTTLLRKAGYRNVLAQSGYEADDLMATVVRHFRSSFKQIGQPCPPINLVSGDHDLYQLVSKSVQVYHPSAGGGGGEFITRGKFEANFHLPPKAWADVKALAGCGTDDVPGMDGVGEKKAAAFYAWALAGGEGNCPGLSRDRCAAVQEFICGPEFARNKRLVTLPFPGCAPFDGLKADKLTPGGWNDVMYDIGATTLLKVTTPWGGKEAVF